MISTKDENIANKIKYKKYNFFFVGIWEKIFKKMLKIEELSFILFNQIKKEFNIFNNIFNLIIG